MSAKKALIGIAVLIAIPIVTLVYIPGAAVRESFGGSAVALRRGVHLRLPLYHRIHRYPPTPILIDEGVEIVTKDKASFKIPVRVAAWPSPGDLLTFHTACSGRAPGEFIRERVREAVQASASNLNADQLLTVDAARQLAPALGADLIGRGIADDGVVIGRPSQQVMLNAVIDYLGRKFPASARRLAEFALEEDPEEPLYHTAMGIVLEGEKQVEDAERAYLDALFLDPSSVEPMSRLFMIYQTSSNPGSLRRLERLLLAALDKSPDSALHHHWMGQLLMRTGRRAEARNAFNNAIRLEPENAEFHISLGGIEIQDGRLEEARTALQEALRLKPNHSLAWFNLGVSFAVEGRMDEAIEQFQNAERAAIPSHPLLNALAQAYEEKGLLDRAAEYLRQSLALHADQPDRRAALSRIEKALSSPD
ncbi:MAG: tetratricopeptide repeat protein [Acidobacteria bacterium]|nr:tetratricopeptide repeat protein [Acidobacteriota bacterium]